MPRPLRIEFNHAWYHVMNRGTNRQFIFTLDSHRVIFLDLLEEVSERFKIEIHGFCLMDNHYHLLVKTPQGNLGRAMRHLDGVYTQRFNRKTNRDGSLFRGRYKAILIDSDQYLLQVSRYIHLNPVDAKICTHPIDYPWSSLHGYINKINKPKWLITNYILMNKNGIDKNLSYLSFVTSGLDEETKKFYLKKHLPSIYGRKEFVEMHLNNLGEAYSSDVINDISHTKIYHSKDQILNAVMNYFHLSLNGLCESKKGKINVPKKIAIYLLAYSGGLNYREIANIFSSLKEYSIPTQMNRFKQLLSISPQMRDYLTDIQNMLIG